MDQIRASAGATQSDGNSPSLADPPADFINALLSLREAKIDPAILYREVPAPEGLSPFAAAIQMIVEDGGHRPAGEGTLVILFDDRGEERWPGGFRLVGYARMEIDEDQSVDPLLGEVVWRTFLANLQASGANPQAVSGTVTRELSETFGGLELSGASLVVELRCSWSPTGLDLKHHLEGWGEALRQNAGVLPSNVTRT